MIIEFGHFAAILALAVAALQMVLPLVGTRTGDRALMATAKPLAGLQLGLVTIAFLALMQAHVVSDFSVINVHENSHATKPLIYRLAGVWGNHEGSLLLWVLMLAAFGAAVAYLGNNLPMTLKANALAVQASISSAFLAFMILTSNPFLRQFPAPNEGLGLNPVLQDPALAFHPPFLYAGYVGFSMAFSFAIAALLEGRFDAAWARWVRPWTLAAWMCLTIGIAMGSWWAYYELGWGGFWFWDPVENASLMPWLSGTALLHSLIVMEKRDGLRVWTMLLAILTFSLSLLGTFLVRSGVLTSVHAFAVDPERGVFVLAILVLFTGGGLALFAWRAPSLRQGAVFAPISREGALVLNNVFLSVICAAVLLGTLYPLLLEGVTGDKISVGPPYFNFVCGLLIVPLLVAVPFGPMLGWKRGDIAAAGQRLWWAAAMALLVPIALLIWTMRGPWYAVLGIGLGLWLIAGALSELALRIKLGAVPWTESQRRLINLPRGTLGTTLAHAGAGLMVIGVLATGVWRSEAILVMKPGEATSIAGYDLTFSAIGERPGPNYTEQVADFVARVGGTQVATLQPAKRSYPVERQSTTEAGIHSAWAGDLYAVIGEPQPGGGFAVRLYFNPLVQFIWLGALVMFLGGALALSDRRLRVGAPTRAKRVPPALQAAE